MSNDLLQFSEGLASLSAQAARSVVAVHARHRLSSSGFIWKPGVVVTAEHTVRRNDDIRVTTPAGETVPAKLAGRDPGTDLAVLRYESTEAANLNSATAERKPGHLVMTVGRSAQTGVIATLGVISGVSETWQTWRGGRLDQFLRLDGTVYAGASGGAVVDAEGKLVGMASDALSRSSTLVVPVVTIERVAGELLKRGHMSRGHLGVGLQPIPLPQATGVSSGLIVLTVEPDSPAAAAGLRIGDVLTAIEGRPLPDTDAVQAFLASEYVGKTVTVAILRAGEPQQARITIGERSRKA